MDLDPLLLSRLQFALVVGFHILFPTFTIGLAFYIALLETLARGRRGNEYRILAAFWIKIFAVAFVLGVVSGVALSYQFGTNWSRFADRTANVVGPLLSYEVLTAFFLEATFLGILLFGRRRVPPAIMLFSAYMVAIGTLVSAFWVLAASSWMHTPAGYAIRDGSIEVADWVQAIFNPSFPYRFTHMTIASFLTTSVAVMGVGAWYVLRGRTGAVERKILLSGLGLAAVLAPAQLVVGDLHGVNTYEHQPAKIAAMEGHWETERGAPAILFALPDPEAERNRLEVKIPNLASLYLTHDWDGEVRGLKSWPKEERPYVPLVFWSFRTMVGIGLLLIVLGIWGVILFARGSLFVPTVWHRLAVGCSPLGFVAVLAGWTTTEVGRQPWTVQGLIRTSESVTPALSGVSVLWSLLFFAAVYTALLAMGVYVILRLIRQGPGAVRHEVSSSAREMADAPAR